MRVSHCVLACLTIVAPVLPAQEPYEKPPEIVRRILEAPRPPVLAVSPDRHTLLFAQPHGQPGIADMAQPMLRLAGHRIDPERNTERLLRWYTALTLHDVATGADRPVLVYNYPKEAKAFYMKENPADPRTVLNNDCLAPEGYGEIIGGSQREDDHDKLLARIRAERLPEDAYGWYLDLRKYGTFVHAGFGLGVERTVAWICGIPHVREAIAFPRQMYRLRP